MTPAWHRHKNVRCVECQVLVWPQITCVLHGPAKTCPVPKLVRCREHQPKRRRR